MATLDGIIEELFEELLMQFDSINSVCWENEPNRFHIMTEEDGTKHFVFTVEGGGK